MQPPRPPALRLPPVVLACVLVPAGLVTLPTVTLFVAASLSQRSAGYDGTLSPTLTGVLLPILIGYPLAGALWFRSRRVTAVPLAWLLVALGVVAIVAVSFWPVSMFASAWYEQWAETQPGGRGYHP